MQEYVALGVFALVYVLIIGRRRFGIPIWTSMTIGAAMMIGLQIIGIEQAFKSISIDVIGFLFGMFSIVSALDRSGVLKMLAIKMVVRAKNGFSLLMIFTVGMGSLAAFLVNDTVALLGIPLIIYVAKHAGIRPVVLLISLSFGITVGSAMTPIGNPQNLLIAINSGIQFPFISFLTILAVPTIINLFVTYFILRMYYRKELAAVGSNKENIDSRYAASTSPLSLIRETETPAIQDVRLAKLSVIILLSTISGFIVSEMLHFLGIVDFGLSVVAMLGAAALYAVSNQRREILKSVDYTVLIFFAAIFIVTSAIWESGAVSMLMSGVPNPDRNDIFQSNAVISAASIFLSQILSNVPFVALYNYVMIENGFTGEHVDQWMMLAAASTVAGNLTILGAASNIIIIEAAEARGVRAFTFLEFFKVGSIVTLANISVYYMFIVFL